MDLRQLSYFVAIAEEEQFTRAAERVSVAQPAVSAQIRRLEAELGEPLFHRDRRAVRLTAAGAALLPHARAALAAADRGRDTIASLRGLLQGRLEVGVAGPVDHRFAKALGDFHRAHPAVEIAFSQQQNEPLLEAVGRGEVDVAIVGIGAQPMPPGVRTRVVATEPLVLAVRTGDPLSSRKTVTLPQLREREMSTLVRGSGLRTVLENACREAGFAPRITAETSDLAPAATHGPRVERDRYRAGRACLPRAGQSALPLRSRRVDDPDGPHASAPADRGSPDDPLGPIVIASRAKRSRSR